AASHRPIAKTVACAPCAVRMSITSRVIETGPVPWKVSATCGRSAGPRLIAVAGSPGCQVGVGDGAAEVVSAAAPGGDADAGPGAVPVTVPAARGLAAVPVPCVPPEEHA